MFRHILRGRIICRYRRCLLVPCSFCYRAQLWHCMQTPYGIGLFKTFSSSIITNEKDLVKIAEAYKEAESNLLKPIHSQNQSCLRLKYGSFYSGKCNLQLKQYYSTKKNVAVSTEEEKMYQDKNPVDDKSIGASINEFKEKESTKQISSSSPEVSSSSGLSSQTLLTDVSKSTADKTIAVEHTDISKNIGNKKIVIELTDVSKSTIDKKIGDESLLSRVQRYLLWRFTWYLKKFQKSLEDEMPDTFNMFRIFSIGFKDFVIDFKDFIKVLIVLSLPGSTLHDLSRRNIELYYNMPRDMLRVFPILVISSVPFGQNIAFPIGYWFPRHLLCHHFWDIQQRHNFAMMKLKKRLFNARPVFRSLQALLPTIENEVDQNRCRAVFYKLGSGIHPTPDEVVSLLPLFQGYPFHIKHIRRTHVNGLLRLHGRSVWFRRKKRLYDHARMIHYLDNAISREGIDALNFDQLKSSLFLRGVNPTNMSHKSMREFLESWLCVSREVDASSCSLLLHLPILLAYNQPTNFALIYV